MHSRVTNPLLRLAALAAISLAVNLPAHAQVTGKIEGVVRDPAGTRIEGAQVVLVGAAFATVTSPRGYYFFNNIPAGTVAIRAAAIGYRRVEIQGLVIRADQTMTQDFVLEPAPLQLEDIVVQAQNPLVPRDAVTTKQTISGEFTERLPVDRISEILALQPGVVTSSRGQITIRGGRPDESVLYVDGVPVSPGFRLDTPGFLGLPPTTIEVGKNAFQEASITTGALSSEYGNAQSGLISIQTRSGGPRFRGNFGYETDEVFGVNHGLGFNRITASLGGPVVAGLNFFLSGVLDGRRSDEGGLGAENAPLFLATGFDTTVAVASAAGDPLADTTMVDVLQFSIFRGHCDQFQASANADIANNYGDPCHGVRIPRSFHSDYQLLGKLNYGFGGGSYLAMTALVSQGQGRSFSNYQAFSPLYSVGNRQWNKVLTLHWSQNLTRAAERALTLDTYLSYQDDHIMQGPLTPGGEISSRDPLLGIMIKPLDFQFDFDNFPITEQLVHNFLRQEGRRSPLDLDNPAQYYGRDRYRNNPYGLQGFLDASGLDTPGFLSMQQEHRLIGRAVLDWQADRYNRIKTGAEGIRYYNAFYAHGLTFSGAADVWIRRPYLWNAFLEDRLDLGDVVIIGGLRYDQYNSNGRHPVWYDSTTGKYEYFPRISTNPDYSRTNPDAVFRPYTTHGYLSPHIQVSFPVTDRTNFRFSYAHQVQVPDFASILRRANTDFSLSGGLYGSDLDFAKTIIFEFGIRQSFGADMVLDLAAYNKNKLSDVTGRSIPLFDPQAHIIREVQRLTTGDYGTIRGIDIRLDRRIGNLFNGVLSYTYQSAKNTGDDPLSYLNRQSVLVSNVVGVTVLPPQATLTSRDSRPHNFTGAVALQFPSDWHAGTLAGSLLRGTGLFATFRYASGTAYTRCSAAPGNQSFTSDGGGCNFQLALGEFNGARLPGEKQFDLRVTRGFHFGSIEVTAYLDARNLFNFKNILRVFSAYNDIVSKPERDNRWAGDSSSFANEANASGVLDTAGQIDLRFGGAVASGCGNWVTQSFTPAPPNCVYLIRAEERYGNGDHIFDVVEMRRASDALYEVDRGSQTFTGTPRRLRVGLEVDF